MVHEGGNVLGPLAQGRQMDAQDVQAVVEVRAERPLGHPLREVTMSGHDDACVEGHRLVAAEGLHLARLQDSQQLGLGATGHVGYFIQEHRSRPCRSEDPLAATVRAGEGAPFVTEQLALDHAVRNGGEIDRQKRLATVGAQVVDGAAHQLLAGTRFTVTRTTAFDAADRRTEPMTSFMAGEWATIPRRSFTWPRMVRAIPALL